MAYTLKEKENKTIAETDQENGTTTDQAACMIDNFFKEASKQQKKQQWEDKYKKSAMQLLWKCQFEKGVIPIELVILVGCLFGKRHEWSLAKFETVSFLANKYAPIKIGQDLPIRTKTEIAKIIKKHGGILKKPRKLDAEVGNIERDYRKTTDLWIEDPLFLLLWEQKYKRYQKFKDRKDFPKMMNIAKKSISH